MDNLNAFENVVEYLENIIPSSDEIDYSVISQIASCFEGKDNFQYLIGKYVELAAPVPENMYAEDIPAGTVAKIWIEADNLNDIIDSAYLLCFEAIEKTGYKIDFENFYWCDVYTYDRYCTPLEKGQKIILDYLLPVIKDE